MKIVSVNYNLVKNFTQIKFGRMSLSSEKRETKPLLVIIGGMVHSPFNQ